MVKVIEVITRCKQQQDDGSLTLQSAKDVFDTLHTQYPEEYRLHRLSRMLIAVLFPLVQSAVEGWDPLTTPDLVGTILNPWTPLLRNEARRAEDGAVLRGDTVALDQQMYTALLGEVVLPQSVLHACLILISIGGGAPCDPADSC